MLYLYGISPQLYMFAYYYDEIASNSVCSCLLRSLLDKSIIFCIRKQITGMPTDISLSIPLCPGLPYILNTHTHTRAHHARTTHSPRTHEPHTHADARTPAYTYSHIALSNTRKYTLTHMHARAHTHQRIHMHVRTAIVFSLHRSVSDST